MTNWPVYARIDGPIVMIGFGSIGKGTLPLIERHFTYDKARFVVIDPEDKDRKLLDERGILKVMDFGVSRLADSAGGVREAGLLIGTPAYMAPEQLLGDDVDERTDLYATGVVLFECLTGRLPFEAESPVALVARVLQESPPCASALYEDVPTAFSALIARLLAKRREARPSSAVELQRLLDQIA